MLHSTLPEANEPASNDIATNQNLTVEALGEHLKHQIESAQARVQADRDQADANYVCRERKLNLYDESKRQIKSLLIERLEALTHLETFSDGSRTVRDDGDEVVTGKSIGYKISVTFPASENRPKQMELSFCIFHDTDVENTVIEYQLQVLPIFVIFKGYDELVVPIANHSVEQVERWVDQTLLAFVDTYFKVYFHDEYQKPQMVVDPVMGTAFAKYLAVETRQFRGRTLHFFTDMSFQRFCENASYYLGGDFDPAVDELFDGNRNE